MKKYIIFLLCVLLAARAFCAPVKKAKFGFESLDLYSLATVNLPENCGGNLFMDSSYVFAYGTKLRFTGIEARYFNSCDKTLGADFGQIQSLSSYYDVFSKSRYSLALDFRKFEKRLDLKLALGSFGASSRMKSPPLSSTLTPFASALSDAAALSPSLPTKTSSKKDDAFFAALAIHSIEKISFGNVRFLPLHFEFFCAKNKIDSGKIPTLWTVRGGFLYKNFLKITNGFWFERYYAQSLDVAQVEWWGEIPVWNSALYDSLMFESTIAIPYFKNKIIFGVTENAQSSNRFWLRDEAYFSAECFSLSASAFLSDNVFSGKEIPLVASGGAKKYSLWQLKLVPEYRVFLDEKSTLKFGAAGYLEEKLVNYEKSSQHTSLDAKFATGVKYSGKTNSFKVIGALSGVNVSQKPRQEKAADLPKISGNVSYSQKLKSKDRISFSVAATFQPNRDSQKNETTQSLRFYYYPYGAVLKSLSLGASASQKKSVCKITPTAKAAFLFKLKKVRINADFCVNSNFDF